MEDEYGTPSYEAPESDEGFSPTMDDDTRSSGDSDSTGTDEVATLKAQIEELNRRVSGQTTSWQQERQARSALEERINKWKAAGLDPDEIDRAISAAQGAVQGPQGTYQQQQQNAVDPAYVHRALAIRDYLRDWESEKERYFSKNSDIDTPEMRLVMQKLGEEEANKELQQFKTVVSGPKEIAKRVIQAMSKMQSHIEGRKEKSMTQTREKVKGQAITESTHSKKRVMDEEPEKPLSDQDYIEMQRSHTRRLKSKG